MFVCKLASVIRAADGISEHAGINSAGRAGGKSDDGKISNFRAIVENSGGTFSVKRWAAELIPRTRNRDIIIQSTGRRQSGASSLPARYDCIIVGVQ